MTDKSTPILRRSPSVQALVLGCFVAALLSNPIESAHAQAVDPSVRVPQTAPPMTVPVASPNFRVNGGPLLGVAPGGVKFVLSGLEISGNTLFSSEALVGLVSSRFGQEADFSVLEDLANTISRHYREAGYPFARAYLPAQDVKGGIVKVEVLEGRYGQIQAVNAPADTPAMVLQALRNQTVESIVENLTRHFDANELAAVVKSIDDLFDARMQVLEAQYVKTDVQRTPNPDAQAFLGELNSGEVIQSQAIERIALIMDDIPGYAAVPVIRPGSLRGTGDLEVRMIEQGESAASVGLDNHGSKASGQNRARVDWAKARNFVFGDQLNFTGMVTDENTWLASVGYGMPLDATGLRLQTNVMLSRYKLGEGEFAGLADGETNRLGATVSYPWLRTQSRNVTLTAGLEHTDYVNNVLSDSETYRIGAIPFGVNFDWRDNLGGGAVTFGGITGQFNTIWSDERAAPPDSSYFFFNLNIAREQRLGERLRAFGRLSLQQANAGIDSSHFMSLGGVNGVRAYPVGEFSGYRGALFQGELSYALPQYYATPYVFFDSGNAKRVTTSDLTESRTLSGYGLGLRFARMGLNLDMSAAWNSGGTDSVVEPGSSAPRLWFSLNSRF